jgi:hypothetical protein
VDKQEAECRALADELTAAGEPELASFWREIADNYALLERITKTP